MNNNSFNKIAWLLLFLSIIIISVGILYNEIEFGLFFIFPFFIGSGIFAFLGILLFFLSMIFFLFNSRSEFLGYNNSFEKEFYNKESKKSKIKTGGVVLIGPIPIIFGSNWKITIITGILTISFILIIIYILPNYI